MPGSTPTGTVRIMTAAEAKMWGYRVLLALAAVGAGYGAYQLRRAQLLVGPIVVGLIAWAALYFAIYDRAAALLASNPGSIDPGNDESAWVGIAALVFAAIAVEASVYATFTPPITTEGTVRAKLVTRGRYQPTAWRLELDDDHYFHIPLGQGVTVEKGRHVSFTHRDAWLGVRIVDSYDLGKRP